MGGAPNSYTEENEYEDMLTISGTSMATPHLAAAVAYVKMKHPNYDQQDVYATFRDNAIDLGDPGKDTEFGYGYVNLADYVTKESMLGGFIDSKIKVTVQNGETWVTILSTKSADLLYDISLGDDVGNYVTIKESLNENKADEMNGTFNFTEDGTYRIAKDFYGYMGSMRNFLFEAVSNEVTIGNDDNQPNQPTTEKKQETTTTAEKKQTVTTNKIVKPARITKFTLKRSKRSVVLSWKKQKNATGYEIYRSTKKKGKYKKIATIKKVSKATYTNKKLKKGKTYYYKVRAYKTQSGKKVYGTFSTIKKVKIKK